MIDIQSKLANLKQSIPKERTEQIEKILHTWNLPVSNRVFWHQVLETLNDNEINNLLAIYQ